ncbi:MAG: hypothetical protein LIO95_01765 [Clostridiales bacterium]|nr:hypothetical protein [Clostridiales bacterium]
MQSEAASTIQSSAPGSPLALLLAAFDGVPHPGSRELRLTEAERRELTEAFPLARFDALDSDAEPCQWYRITLAAPDNT